MEPGNQIKTLLATDDAADWCRYHVGSPARLLRMMRTKHSAIAARGNGTGVPRYKRAIAYFENQRPTDGLQHLYYVISSDGTEDFQEAMLDLGEPEIVYVAYSFPDSWGNYFCGSWHYHHAGPGGTLCPGRRK
jgi:hypothetical protein